MKVGKKEFSSLKTGSILEDGDKIRTGNSGFVAIIFIDDKSTLKIKENSEAVITGQRTTKNISKKINLDGGTIRASISKQNVDFVIQTPTSVASVKGTDFWLISDDSRIIANQPKISTFYRGNRSWCLNNKVYILF